MYQTAKVSKLLLAINSGKAHLYHGKSLEEIEVSDNFDSDSDTAGSSSLNKELIQRQGTLVFVMTKRVRLIISLFIGTTAKQKNKKIRTKSPTPGKSQLIHENSVSHSGNNY